MHTIPISDLTAAVSMRGDRG